MRLMANKTVITTDAYQLALGYLARREHSMFELCQKLNHKGCAATAINQAIEQLLAQDYLSDARFVAMFVRSKAARGQGPVKIRHELQQHHIEPALLEAALIQSEIDWFALAQHAYEKRFGSKPIKDFADKQKRQRYLYQRGFTTEMISVVISDSYS